MDLTTVSQPVTFCHALSQRCHDLSRRGGSEASDVTVCHGFVTLSRTPLFAKCLPDMNVGENRLPQKECECHAHVYKKQIRITAKAGAPEWARKSAMRATFDILARKTGGEGKIPEAVERRAGAHLCAELVLREIQ